MRKRGKEIVNRGRNAPRQRTLKHDSSNVRNAVLYLVQQKLRQYDGRAAGIKFNKLVFLIYKHFSGATNQELHFDIPYRWYLYGAVVDTAELGGVVSIDHEEDEIRANVHWNGSVPNIDAAVRPEIERDCNDFCEKYPGTDNYDNMLKEHYQWAEIEFQRSFLAWSLIVSKMAYGYSEISVRELGDHLKSLEKNYLEELEPRLTPSFRRLYLCLDGVLSRSSQPGMEELKIIKELMWDFWATFCLFLSIKHHNDISERRLEGYKSRAEQELVAYKRRLNAVLETNYLRSGDYKLDKESLKVLSTLYEIRVLRVIGRDEEYSAPATR